jgi:hypothetical protein
MREQADSAWEDDQEPSSEDSRAAVAGQLVERQSVRSGDKGIAAERCQRVVEGNEKRF